MHGGGIMQRWKFVTLAAIAWFSVAFLQSCDTRERPITGSSLPSFTLPGVPGDSVRSADYAGKTLLVVFWATHCPPCLMEIPMLKNLQASLGGQGFQVIGISLDDDPATVLPKAQARFAFNYPIAIGNAQVVADFGNFDAIPTAFLVGPDGKIRERLVGVHPESELRAKIAAAMAVVPTPAPASQP